MYIFRFGETGDSSQISLVTKIQNLLALAQAKNWSDFQQSVNQLLAANDTPPTLEEPLKLLANSTDPVKDVNALLTIAQNEVSATEADRIRNEDLLSRKIDNLVNIITDFKTANQGLVALWNKISGKEKVLFTQIQDKEKAILSDIKITPLTTEGRKRVMTHYNIAISSATQAWSLIGGSTVVFLGYVLLQVLRNYAGIAASAGLSWGYGKVKERTAKRPSKVRKKDKGKKKKKKKD